MGRRLVLTAVDEDVGLAAEAGLFAVTGLLSADWVSILDSVMARL
jgi:hypothetical protein